MISKRLCKHPSVHSSVGEMPRLIDLDPAHLCKCRLHYKHRKTTEHPFLRHNLAAHELKVVEAAMQIEEPVTVLANHL